MSSITISAHESLRKISLGRESRRKKNSLRDFILESIDDVEWKTTSSIDDHTDTLFKHLEDTWAKTLKTAEYVHEFKWNTQLLSDAAILIAAENHYDFNMSYPKSGSPTAIVIIDTAVVALKTIFDSILDDATSSIDFKKILIQTVQSEKFQDTIEYIINGKLSELGYTEKIV